MITINKKHIELGLKLLGLTALALFLPDAAAHAGPGAVENLGDLAANVNGAQSNLLPVLSGVSYTAGSVFAATTVVKMRELSQDAGGQTKPSHVIGRGLAAAAFLGLPTMANAISTSVTGGGVGKVAQYQKLDTTNITEGTKK